MKKMKKIKCNKCNHLFSKKKIWRCTKCRRDFCGLHIRTIDELKGDYCDYCVIEDLTGECNYCHATISVESGERIPEGVECDFCGNFVEIRYLNFRYTVGKESVILNE